MADGYDQEYDQDYGNGNCFLCSLIIKLLVLSHRILSQILVAAWDPADKCYAAD